MNPRGRTPRPLADRLFGRVVKTSSGCWEFTGPKRKGGYGALSSGGTEGRQLLAHRAAWTLTNGPIPDGLFVLHHCDNPPCCNPDHLFLGTLKDNTADARAKGRLYSGPRHHWHCKPNPNAMPEAVRVRARELRAQGLSARQIAAEIGGFSRQLFSSVVRGIIPALKGGQRGSSHHNAKLTETMAADIRRRKGESVRALAECYGVSESTVYKVWQGKVWAGAPDAVEWSRWKAVGS